MRLLVATPLLPPDVGGPAIFAKSLIAHLPNRGVDISVAYFGKVKKLPPGIRHLAYFVMLWRLARGCDALLALDPVSVGLPSALVAILRKKKFFVRIAGDFAWEQGMNRFGISELLDEFVRNKQTHPMVRMFVFIERYVARKATRIIVPSAYFKKIITAWGIDPKKIEVILSSVEDIAVAGRRDVLRGILQFDGVLILSAGRLVPWKGFQTLISLMPALRTKFPDLKLMIAGDGPGREELERLIKEKNLENCVVLGGNIERDVLLRYIKVSDLFVLNTGYEGLSHQLLEVLAVGVPVVTTRVGGNPEVIEDGKNGLLVPYDNSKALEGAVVKILTNKTLAAKLVAGGKRSLAKFSQERMIDAVEKFLKENV